MKKAFGTAKSTKTHFSGWDRLYLQVDLSGNGRCFQNPWKSSVHKDHRVKWLRAESILVTFYIFSFYSTVGLFVCINKNHNETPIKKADVSITNVHHHIISEAILPVAYSSLLETIGGSVAMRWLLIAMGVWHWWGSLLATVLTQLYF